MVHSSNLCLGWYVDKVVSSNPKDFVFEEGVGSYRYTKKVRENYFANEECVALSEAIKKDSFWNEDIKRLCEAVFAERVGQRELLFKHIYTKLKKEYKEIDLKVVVETLRHNCLQLGGATFLQFVTMDFLLLEESFSQATRERR